MIIGKVIGSITSTINHADYEDEKLLTVEKIRPDGTPTGDYLVAIDRADSGVGETVLVLDEGNGGRQVLQSKNAPVRSVIVGHIDAITLEPEAE